METIRLEEVKEYCDKHNIGRNEWVAGGIDKVLAGTHVIQYKCDSGFKVTIDLEYIHSHMQSLNGFDLALHDFMINGSEKLLRGIERKQAVLTIGELADDFEIGK